MIKKKCLICNKEFLVIPSSKKKFCSRECHHKFQIGKKRLPFSSEHKKKISKALMGNNNSNWMGNNVNYPGIHAWVRRHKGKPQVCEKCGSVIHLEWANKDHSYKRNLDDYIPLCRSCHMKYDIQRGLRRKSRSVRI